MKQIKTIRENAVQVCHSLHDTCWPTAQHRHSMRAIGQLIGMIRHLFWWPAMVGIVLVLGSGAAALWQTASISNQTSQGDRWNRSFYLAASVRNAVLMVRTSRTEDMQLLLVDFETGKRTRLKSERSLPSVTISVARWRAIAVHPTATRPREPRTRTL
jgi:hypothetical protein